MKTCQTCGNPNADEMRFCLNCGGSLPDAPVIVNVGGSQPGQSNPGSNPFGQQPPQFGQQPPQFGQQPPQQNYSMVPPNRGGGKKKIWIAVAGVFAVFFLLFIAIAGIVGYNLYKNEQVRTTPTPVASPSSSTKPSASPSASKSASPSPSASPSDSPKEPAPQYDKVKLTFKKVWVDYNEQEGDEFGMRVHLKFDVTKMKDLDSFAVIFFQKEDGDFLDNGTGKTRSKDGRIAVFKPLKPGFDPVAYEDLEIFVPYDSLKLDVGNYKLKMDIDLVDIDENLIKHVTFKDFEYEQK